jgi:Holliday junction DNA helicase RuvB
MAIETDRLIAADPASPQEEAFERALRPKALSEYVGQEKSAASFRFSSRPRAGTRSRSTTCCCSDPGPGKATLAHIIARDGR